MPQTQPAPKLDQAEILKACDSHTVQAADLRTRLIESGRSANPIPILGPGGDLLEHFEALKCYVDNARYVLERPASAPAKPVPAQTSKPAASAAAQSPETEAVIPTHDQNGERLSATQRCRLAAAQRELASQPENEQLAAILARTDLNFSQKCEAANKLRRNVVDSKIEAQLREAGHTVTPNRKLTLTEQCLLAKGLPLDTKVTK